MIPSLACLRRRKANQLGPLTPVRPDPSYTTAWGMIRCLGADIRIDPFALELVIDAFPEVESRQRLIRRFADIYRNRLIGGPGGGWTVEAMRHRDALAALDRRMEGYSYRRIAIFLYGEKAVRDDWNSPDQTMKNRVIRRVRRLSLIHI